MRDGKYTDPKKRVAHWRALRLALAQTPPGSDYMAVARALVDTGLPREERFRIAGQAGRMARGVADAPVREGYCPQCRVHRLSRADVRGVCMFCEGK